MNDSRLDFPATRRNRDPILEVLRRVLVGREHVLELASGSGQHAAYFSAALPESRWTPTDPEPEHRASISAWCADHPNVADPLDLDVGVVPWAVPASVDAIVCANLIHIAPWEICLALLQGASVVLSPEQPLVLYGPFAQGGHHSAPSNAAFDQSLKDRDSRWGVRDLDVVRERAAEHGLHLEEQVEMPANNLSVVFRRRRS
jgi:hypothetical protein